MTLEMLFQLLVQVRFALQLDECTDSIFFPANPAQLFTLCFVNEENFVEEMLFCKTLKGRLGGKYMY